MLKKIAVGYGMRKERVADNATMTTTLLTNYEYEFFEGAKNEALLSKLKIGSNVNKSGTWMLRLDAIGKIKTKNNTIL